VNFSAGTDEDWLVVSGEIRNDTSKDYNFAMFKIILYNKQMALGSGIIKIYDFRRRTTKVFELPIEVPRKMIQTIVKYEVLYEGGY
jgi:hypothetical protein